MAEAVALTNAGESTVYMLTPMTDFTFAKDLAAADGFVLVEEETDPEDDERFPAEPEQWTESDNEEDEEPEALLLLLLPLITPATINNVAEITKTTIAMISIKRFLFIVVWFVELLFI